MIDKTELTRVVEDAIAGTDLFVVKVTVTHDNIITVDLDSMSSIDIDQCMMVNDAVLAAFDRDVEDYELTVGSYGISSPLLLPRQYEKNLGGEVEVLTTAGSKLKGTLTSASENEFTITVPTKTKIDGKKRPEIVDVEHTFKYDEVKYTKNILQF